MKNNRVCVGHAVNPFTVYNYMIIEVRDKVHKTMPQCVCTWDKNDYLESLNLKSLKLQRWIRMDWYHY